MGMKLGSCVSINRSCGVMLERCCDELASRLRRMNIADASLCVAFQLMQRDADAFTMCITHALIATHKRSKRNGLWCGERCIPSCAMFRARDLLAMLVLIGSRRLMLDELR